MKCIVISVPAAFTCALLGAYYVPAPGRPVILKLLAVLFTASICGLVLSAYPLEGGESSASAVPAVILLLYTSQFLVFFSFVDFLVCHCLVLALYILLCLLIGEDYHIAGAEGAVLFVSMLPLSHSFYLTEQSLRNTFKSEFRCSGSPPPNTLIEVIQQISTAAQNNLNVKAKELFYTLLPPSESQKIAPVLVAESVDLASTRHSSAPLEILKSFGSIWNFNSFALFNLSGGSPLLISGIYICGFFGLERKLKCPAGVLPALFTEIERLYCANSYHNSTHAADVLSSFIFMATNSQLFSYTSNEELFACVVASLAHDVGHPARTNGFLMNSEDELALLYNDHSVLEMMHASLTYHLLRKQGVFHDFSFETRR